jgi:hypothetical protein
MQRHPALDAHAFPPDLDSRAAITCSRSKFL